MYQEIKFSNILSQDYKKIFSVNFAVLEVFLELRTETLAHAIVKFPRVYIYTHTNHRK